MHKFFFFSILVAVAGFALLIYSLSGILADFKWTAINLVGILAGINCLNSLLFMAFESRRLKGDHSFNPLYAFNAMVAGGLGMAVAIAFKNLHQ